MWLKISATFAFMIARRIIEPVFLGCTANVIINLLFNPENYHSSINEFVVACALSVPITELNRYIDQKLEMKMGWAENPVRRLLTHFFQISFCLLIVLNVLGSGYMLVTGSGFFTISQLIVINLVVLALAAILTIIKWSVHFYSQWISAEDKAKESARKAQEVISRVIPPLSLIEVQKGMSRIRLEIQAIRLAKMESGTVRVYANDGESGVFSGTLSELILQLPDYFFFRASRDTIVHRDVIRKTSSSTFGKVLLTISSHHVDDSIVVSRPKAAAFRRWYNSNSA